jgi:hypothetical protein
MIGKDDLKKKFRERGFSVSQGKLEELMKGIEKFVERRVEEMIYVARLDGKKRI